MSCKKILGQRQDFIAPLAERLNAEPHDVQAEVQVLAKRAFADHGGQVAMRGGDDSQIDRNRLDAADRHDGSLLNRAEQLGLDERAATRRFHRGTACRRRHSGRSRGRRPPRR